MAEDQGAATLYHLSETNQTVADPEADVRRRTVVDRYGEEIGEVDDLLIDEQENKVRFLQVGAGGFLGMGKEHFLVPVEAITAVDADRVHIDRERGGLTDAPGYDPELVKEPLYYSELYGWWGYPPFWGPGYIYPAYPPRA